MYECVHVNCQIVVDYPSSFGGVNHPFSLWIFTNDLYACWAVANVYWDYYINESTVTMLCRISSPTLLDWPN